MYHFLNIYMISGSTSTEPLRCATPVAQNRQTFKERLSGFSHFYKE